MHEERKQTEAREERQFMPLVFVFSSSNWKDFQGSLEQRRHLPGVPF